jgi:3-deoxy-manno-octulosonate cytidylyltransferase (CMP-KDO synthetase)
MKKPKVLGVIPARMGSTRLAGKMLADINGKPLVWHTWHQAMKAKNLDAVVVATDSAEIRDALVPYGAEVVMTSTTIQTGTDRVAAAAAKFRRLPERPFGRAGFTPDIVLNIQGDEPMMPASAINKTAELLIKNPGAVMSTVATHFKSTKDLPNPGFVKVVRDLSGKALYFSRSIMPYARARAGVEMLWHIGIYGFRFSFLKKYTKLAQTPLEKTELLEQLRALENGYDILVGVGEYDRMEVNTPEELAMVRKAMKKN